MKNLFYVLILLPSLVFALEGLKVKDKIPAISLKDLDGKTFEFSTQQKKTVLVFYRGSWCPYCMKQLSSIQKDVISKLGAKAQLVAISVDRLNIAKKMRKKFKFDFIILSDAKATSLKAFKIVNKLNADLVKMYKATYKIDVEGDSGELHHMVAHPAVFVLENGKITFAEVNTDYKVRTKNEDILKAIK